MDRKGKEKKRNNKDIIRCKLVSCYLLLGKVLGDHETCEKDLILIATLIPY